MALLSMVNAGDTGSPEFDAAIGVAGQDFSQPDPFDAGLALVTSALFGSGADSGAYMGNFGGAENTSEAITSNNGIAKTLGDNWLSESFDKATKWFDGQKDSTKGAITTLAGSFIKGLFSYNDEQRKIKALEKSSEANMLNAQTNAGATAQKFDNASAIGKTNFGAQPQGLIFRNKLAPRQARAGYGG